MTKPTDWVELLSLRERFVTWKIAVGQVPSTGEYQLRGIGTPFIFAQGTDLEELCREILTLKHPKNLNRIVAEVQAYALAEIRGKVAAAAAAARFKTVSAP